MEFLNWTLLDFDPEALPMLALTMPKLFAVRVG